MPSPQAGTIGIVTADSSIAFELQGIHRLGQVRGRTHLICSPPAQLPGFTLERYRDAKVRTRSLRAELRAEDDHMVRMIFAQNVDEAERLLTEVREPRPLGEE